MRGALLVALLIYVSGSWAASYDPSIHERFLGCVSDRLPSPAGGVSDHLYVPGNQSYDSVLLSSLDNQRFAGANTSKPVLIFTPTHPSHIQASVICCKKLRLSLRTRSGGHDYEGLSYRSFDEQPFMVLDLSLLNAVHVDVEKGTAWVEAGATLGELYYHIGRSSSTYGFPAGVCPTLGLGGHVSGGGMGSMVRKYGLAADNVVDVKIVNAKGDLLDRSSMGEEFFWAVRGGGGASFGVVVSWKLRLVTVPSSVASFKIKRTVEEGAIDLIHKWQFFAPSSNESLFMEAFIIPTGGKNAAIAIFNFLYLGNCQDLLQEMNTAFPELGLRTTDCREMTWVESTLFIGDDYLAGNFTDKGLEALLDRSLQPKGYVKAKSDYVVQPIPRPAWEGIWDMLADEGAMMFMDPYGGVMDRIPADAIPFPHRKGNLYNIQYLNKWFHGGAEEEKKRLSSMKRLYDYMAPYVSKNPRAVYVNFRDLDLGKNDNGGNTTTFAMAEKWGRHYFKDNFKRLALVKGKVDRHNFFRNEQSIPVYIKTQG